MAGGDDFAVRTAKVSIMFDDVMLNWMLSHAQESVDLKPWADLITQISWGSLTFPLRVMGGIIAFLWILEFLDALILRGRLDRLGIYPRTLKGLTGILFSPLLHGNFQHLAANTMPFLMLGGLILLLDVHTFVIVTGVVWLVSGAGVWLFGRPRSLHIGMSGVVFGYLGFILARAYFEGSALAIALALIVGILFGGLIWGVLPSRRGQSWESHLFGIVGGGIAARFLPELKQWIWIYAFG